MYMASGGEVVYLLELQNDKWYVGKTRQMMNRMDQHVGGSGAAWVKAHGGMKSQSVLSTHQTAASWEETKQTLLMMKKYGLNNVRGAEYCHLREFSEGDCERMSYAAIHHLECEGRKEIEDIFRESLKTSRGRVPYSYTSSNTSQYTHTSSNSSALQPLTSGGSSTKRKLGNAEDADDNLLHRLKELRKDIAQDIREVNYIYKDMILGELIKQKPTCGSELAAIIKKPFDGLDPYNYAFLKLVSASNHCKECQKSEVRDKDKPFCPSCFKKVRK